MSNPRDLPVWKQDPVLLVPVDPAEQLPSDEEMDAADADDALVFEALKQQLHDLKAPDTILEIPSLDTIVAEFEEIGGRDDT